MNRPNEWSFAPATAAPTARRTPGRALVITAATVALVLVAALVTWLVWPASTPPNPSATSNDAPRPLLSDKPPTVIENGIEPRTLYPPGYVDFDVTKFDESTSSFDANLEHDYSVTPTECKDNPLFAGRFRSISDADDPEKYEGYPVNLFMFPVDDPGGNNVSRGFTLNVWPTKNPSDLDAYRQWYGKCQNAKVTSTTKTKDGQIVEQKTTTLDETVIAAPSSEAVDSFALAGRTDEQFSLYGLVRGMMVGVTCPPTQKAAGVQLWRTVIHRIQQI